MNTLQYMQNKSQEEEELIKDLRQLFYPNYSPSSNTQQFLSNYDNLFDWLRMIDELTLDDVKKIKLQPKFCIGPNISMIQDSQKIVYFIIDLLNKLCTYCHRKELRQKINSQLKTYKTNLKGIPIAKYSIAISQWQNIYKYQTKICNFSQNSKNAQQLQNQQKSKEILRILDELYLQYRRIPNIYSLLLTYPQTFLKLYKFQEGFITSQKLQKSSMPLAHRYYLGIIAASTYGCRYMWNFLVPKFIKAGGNLQWIQEGIESTPNHIKKLSQMSYIMAYNFKISFLEEKYSKLCQGGQIKSSLLIEGLFVLGYYHFLSCFCLIHGLIPQSSQYQVYLPQIPNLKPSMDSFQTMKKASKKQEAHQKQIAQQFTEMYSWDSNSDTEIKKLSSVKQLQKSNSFDQSAIKRLKINQIDFSGNDSLPEESQLKQRADSQNQFIVIMEQEQILSKIKNLKTMKNIQAVFHKYVQFDERMSGVQFKHKKKSRNSNVQYGSTQNIELFDMEKSESDYDFIYASEWNYQDNAVKRIESIIGKSANNLLKGLLKSLRFLQKQKSKNLKIYYESLQNYMYEYVSYIQLMSKGVSLVQKNYIKLLTRSPFLYNQKSYKKMKEDLQNFCQVSSPLQFCLQILSYKLELNFSLATYIYDKYIQNQE